MCGTLVLQEAKSMKKIFLLTISSLFFISCMNYVPEQTTKSTVLSQPVIQQTEPEDVEPTEIEQGQEPVTQPEEQQTLKNVIIKNESTTLIVRRFSIRYKTLTGDEKTKTLKIQDVGPGAEIELDPDFSIPEDSTMVYISIDMNVVNYPENGWFAKKLDLELLLDMTKRKNIKIMGDRKDIKIEMTEIN